MQTQILVYSWTSQAMLWGHVECQIVGLEHGLPAHSLHLAHQVILSDPWPHLQIMYYNKNYTVI
jgi:hypothetical protein